MQCWKNSLAQLRQMGILSEVSTECYSCGNPLRYDDHVKVSKYFESNTQSIIVALVHSMCDALDTRLNQMEN